MRPPNVYVVFMGYDADPLGRPLALVVYRNGSHERRYHDELKHLAPVAGVEKV